MTVDGVLLLERNMKIGIGVVCVVVLGAVGWYGVQVLSQPQRVTFHVEVESDIFWQGSVGGDRGQMSVDSMFNVTYVVKDSVVCSAVIQKEGTGGYVTVRITRGDRILVEQSTEAPYGVVSVTATSKD